MEKGKKHVLFKKSEKLLYYSRVNGDNFWDKLLFRVHGFFIVILSFLEGAVYYINSEEYLMKAIAL